MKQYFAPPLASDYPLWMILLPQVIHYAPIYPGIVTIFCSFVMWKFRRPKAGVIFAIGAGLLAAGIPLVYWWGAVLFG